MSQESKSKTITCPCGNIAFYLDREDDIAKFGLTIDEIAAATAWMPIVNQDNGTVSWLCRDCVNRARRKPMWYSVQERLPQLKDDQDCKRVMLRLGLVGSEKGVVASGEYRAKTGFGHHNCLPTYESETWKVTHWAELPAGPYDPDETCNGISPEDHSAALFSASKIVLDSGEWKWTQEEQEAMARLCQWASILLPLPQRPMRCECGSTKINTTMDVGSDIDPGGEETQHLDRCSDCGSSRLWGRRLHNFATPTVWWGKWSKREFDF